MSQHSLSKRYQLAGQARNDLRLSTQVLERGKDHIVSFAGTSQFTAQGVSACGLAAFNFARIAFRTEQNRKNIADVLNELSTREIIEEIVAICAGWSSDMHLEVDDIHNLPIFSRSLKLTSIEYGRPHPKHFQALLENMQKIEKSTVMIITRPPEIIACFKFAKTTDPRSSTPNTPVFVIFDSHPRLSHPQGAGLSFSTSIENTARTLSDILPTMDEGIFDSSDFQWQAQLLSNCSAHVYVTRHRRKDHEAAMIRCSLAILDLRTKISELQGENEKLDSSNKQLESETHHLRASIRQEQAKAKQEAFPSLASLASRTLGRSFGLVSHAAAGPSRASSTHSRSDYTPPITPAKRALPSLSPSTPGISGAKSIFAHNPPPVPSEKPPSYEELEVEGSLDSDSDDPWVQSTRLALQLQNEFDSEDQQLRQEHARLVREVGNQYDFEDSQPRQDHGRRARQRQNQTDFGDGQLRQEHARVARQLQNRFGAGDQRVCQDNARFAPQFQKKINTDDQRVRQDHARLARQLQHQYDAEDQRLRQEQEELAHFIQATFRCSICMDEQPEDDVAKIDGCMHRMCRPCLRVFVSSKIQEHRYPIFCPMCTAEMDQKAQPSAISRLMMEQLGVSEEQFQTLTEMELAEFTIQIHCRQCQRPAFVDREDHAEVFNIVCPQSDCHHVWCKKCEQTIVADGPKHSCDGSNELDHLMKEKGWKHCPNCRTPILKETGCNHMMCISPGCNTHFCYICGDMIVRSALNQEINEAVSSHFSKCQLFFVPD